MADEHDQYEALMDDIAALHGHIERIERVTKSFHYTLNEGLSLRMKPTVTDWGRFTDSQLRMLWHATEDLHDNIKRMIALSGDSPDIQRVHRGTIYISNYCFDEAAKRGWAKPEMEVPCKSN